jgi:hypothetical protein
MMDVKEIISALYSLYSKAENIKEHIEPEVLEQAADLLKKHVAWKIYPTYKPDKTGDYIVHVNTRHGGYVVDMHYSKYWGKWNVYDNEVSPTHPMEEVDAWLPIPAYEKV